MKKLVALFVMAGVMTFSIGCDSKPTPTKDTKTEKSTKIDATGTKVEEKSVTKVEEVKKDGK